MVVGGDDDDDVDATCVVVAPAAHGLLSFLSLLRAILLSVSLRKIGVAACLSSL